MKERKKQRGRIAGEINTIIWGEVETLEKRSKETNGGRNKVATREKQGNIENEK